jgi:transcriptional regulator with XRE-family HTH domain
MTTFAEKLKRLRKQFKLSQEQLAEKLGVSRQAITKWETEGGLPDTENLLSLATLFSVTLDDLLSHEKRALGAKVFTYENVTEYDLDSAKHFDIHAASAMEVSLKESEGEKLRVRLASHVIQTLGEDFKVRIDAGKKRLDLDIRPVGRNSRAEITNALSLEISLPAKFCAGIELAVVAEQMTLVNLTAPFELDGKVAKVRLVNVKGAVSLNSGVDMEITCDLLPSVLEVNQISASSKLVIPSGSEYRLKTKGRTNRIRFAVDGKPTESRETPDAEHCVELAGMNAELLIDEATP